MDKDVSLSKSPVLSASQEKRFVWLLCVLAALHVFIFSAAFPFFNNVDEPAHFDLVLDYAHGHVPRGLENTSRESSVYLALFCSCAFFGPTSGPMPPPPWTEPVDKMKQDLAFNATGWQTQKNYEDSEPPLYYALAGLWWDSGQSLGLASGRLLYWLRFFNIVLVIALVWLAYLAARLVFPNNLFIRIAVPALTAFMPQTAFYSIENDVLSPLCFGLVFLCVLKWLAAEANPSPQWAVTTGIVFAATWLTKATNLPLLSIAALAILIKTCGSFPHLRSRAVLPLLYFLCAAVPPILIWAMWSRYHYGDFTGSKLKMGYLTWTIKPFGEWWQHPIFTPTGFWTYVSGQLATFWQGEFQWYYPPHSGPLALPGSDLVYTILSLALLAFALPGLFSRTNPDQSERKALQLGLVCFVVELGFFGLASIIYDFHRCPNPSREHPYFHMGRMLLGSLIPFLLVIVYGLNRLMNRFGNATKFAILAVMILVMLGAEIATDWPAFSNPYNWFHLP
jgi:hypothetical protein